jgi:outer membrane protein insertion porin family
VHQLLQATGVGLNIDTKTGIFTLIYALGKQNNNNFDLRTSKIHVGFNVLF